MSTLLYSINGNYLKTQKYFHSFQFTSSVAKVQLKMYCDRFARYCSTTHASMGGRREVVKGKQIIIDYDLNVYIFKRRELDTD